MAKKITLSTMPIPPRAIVLDTETTGLSPRMGDRIVELAAIELLDGTPSGKTFHTYLNPQRNVPAAAERVHGLSTFFLRDKPLFADILPAWLDFIGDEATPLWAHNASFDERFLKAELAEAGHQCAHTYRCSLQLSRAVFGKGKHDLNTLAGRIGLTFGGRGAHSALADTEVLGGVLSALLWPEEAKLAAQETCAPKSKRAAPAKSSSAKPAAKITFELPSGFAPLQEDTDARIRRYDELDLTDLLTSRGKLWSKDEEASLGRDFLTEGKDIPTLVAQHGRSPAALMLKLEALGVVAEGHPYARRQR